MMAISKFFILFVLLRVYKDVQRYIFPYIQLLSPKNEVRILLSRRTICSQLYAMRKAEQ